MYERAEKYVVYDLEGRKIAEGSPTPLAEAFGVTRSSLINSGRYGYLMKKKYVVTAVGRSIEKRPVRSRKKHQEKMEEIRGKEEAPQEQTTLDYLEKHLKWFGNTCLGYMPKEDVQKYLRQLRRRGIKARAKLIKEENQTENWWKVWACE